MNMDNFHINKYTFLFLKCTYSLRHKLAPQVYLLPFLHGINLLLKFIPRQLSILRPHGLYHSACLLVHSLTHTASATTSTTTSRHKPSVYPSPSQHILHPHGNPPLRMPYVVTTNASSIRSKRARHQKPTTSSPPHFAATPRLKTSDLYRGDDEQQSRQQRSKEDGGGKR
ncbi:hypothetical protein F2Q69_00002070 [Brassica cretica]|uniref:Uncharacterized protein n=1 Tax=Brassica cretica TaxID=69181 RepID=A0A8S9P903_BRACR|nr:hypothetical protein F2Q69_00002070 [Brassica cretica]